MRIRHSLLAAVVTFGVAGAPGAVRAQCDAGLALGDTDPLSGAAAIELCELSAAGSPGVVSASYVAIDGSTDLGGLPSGLAGVGLLDAFGAALPQAGARMLALSSGTARAPDDPGYQDPAGFSKGFFTNHAPGLPDPIPACSGLVTTTAYDSAALELVLKVPSDAKSLSFRFKFHTFDYPALFCSTFDDGFAVTLNPSPPGAAASGNIVFDGAGNPMTVNSPELVSVCAPAMGSGLDFACADGAAELASTGYESHGATAWLRTAAPVEADSTITLTFGIWDSGDGVFDSLVLIDDFRWSSEELAAPVTLPAPEPGAAGRATAAGAALVLVARARRRARRA